MFSWNWRTKPIKLSGQFTTVFISEKLSRLTLSKSGQIDTLRILLRILKPQWLSGRRWSCLKGGSGCLEVSEKGVSPFQLPNRGNLQLLIGNFCRQCGMEKWKNAMNFATRASSYKKKPTFGQCMFQRSCQYRIGWSFLYLGYSNAFCWRHVCAQLWYNYSYDFKDGWAY